VPIPLVEAVIRGLLGSLIHLALAICEARAFPNKFEIFGHLTLGPVAGGLAYTAGFTDPVSHLFAGFFSIDFIRMLARGYKPKPPEEEG